MSESEPGCVKTIFWEFWRKIDSRGTRLAQQNFVVTVRSILLLRESDCSKRFYTAWVRSDGISFGVGASALLVS